jgi:RNA ligase (TIGR02306 family)
LRQQTSFGFVIENTNNYPEGQDLKKLLGIIKYEPVEPKQLAGDIEKDHPLFDKYTDIQNIRNFPDIFQDGETVLITEKLHGSNGRLALILTDNEDQSFFKRIRRKIYSILSINKLRTKHGLFSFMVGSHAKRRKLGKESLYEIPLTQTMKKFMIDLRDGFNYDVHSVIVYGEIFGGKIQDLKYGKTSPDFRVFDIKINGKYLHSFLTKEFCKKASIPMVPILYEGPFSQAIVNKHTNGATTLMNENAHIREGVVIRPYLERDDFSIGRVILKSISEDYLLRKDGTEFH